MNDCYAIGFKELKVIVRFLKSQELLDSDDLEYPGIFPEICFSIYWKRSGFVRTKKCKQSAN